MMTESVAIRPSKVKFTAINVSCQEVSWRVVLLDALGHLLAPMAVPIMMILSKLRGKEISWLTCEYETGFGEIQYKDI